MYGDERILFSPHNHRRTDELTNDSRTTSLFRSLSLSPLDYEHTLHFSCLWFHFGYGHTCTRIGFRYDIVSQQFTMIHLFIFNIRLTDFGKNNSLKDDR
jgi:hypothetical protein